MLPYLMALLGNLSAGWLSSALIRKGWPVNAGRKSIICVCYGGFALSILLAAYSQSAILAVVFISLAMGFLGGNLAIFWTLPIDFSRKHAGFIGGFMSTVSDLGGMVAPAITGFIVQTTGKWENAFSVGAALAIIGMLLTGFLLSVKPLKIKSVA
jgi:MFS family permease